MMLRHHPAPVARQGSPRERGETLIELMATVVLMGVSVVALVGSLIGAMQVSTQQRNATRAGNEAVNVIEALRSAPYVNCAGVTSYASSLPTAAPRFTYSIAKVEWLVPDPTPADPYPNPTWTPSTGGSCTDPGVQKITVRATAAGPGSVTRTLTFVKRDRTCVTDPSGPKVC